MTANARAAMAAPGDRQTAQTGASRRHADRMRVYVSALVVVVLALGGTARPAAAQAAPETCAAWKELRQYVIDNPDIFDSRLGVAQLAELNKNLQTFCGESPADVPAPSSAPEPTPAAAPPSAVAQATPGPPADSQDRTDACNLLTSSETGAVIGGAASADTPAALPGASGCEYRLDGDGDQPYLDVIYAQADGDGLYATLLSGASQQTSSAITSVSDVGDNAFTYAGQNGPGIVVLKAGKVVVLEFSYTNPGANALLTLARQAAARVR
jgi:hypothetical protein